MKKLRQYFMIIGLCSIIFQAQSVTKTVNVSTPGTLSTLLTSDEASTIENLTITGIIDARDVKFMRDTMSVLANLDITGVDIAVYTGTDGTGTGSYTYPANEMPVNSFVFVSYPIITMGKSSLKSVKLPNSITSIGNRAFYRCSGLTESITIPESVSSIGYDVFTGCSGITSLFTNPLNPKYSALDGVIFNKNQTNLVAYPAGRSGEYQIPGTVKIIESGAFSECRKLTGNLMLPNTVSVINDQAFYTCFGLSGSLALPDTLTSIETQAFEGCSGFTGLLTIPNSVKTIGAQAFRNCSNLTGSLRLSNSLSTIEFGAFAGCSNLSGNLVIPASVKTIEDKAFWECNGFKELELPKSISSIPLDAFYNCNGFEKISVANPVPPEISYETFPWSVQTSCQLIVPVGSLTAYRNAPGWTGFINITEQDFTTGTNPGEAYVSKIYTANGQIIVESNTTHSRIEIFSTSGRLVKAIYTEGERTEIALPNGIYIVRTGNHSQKVIL